MALPLCSHRCMRSSHEVTTPTVLFFPARVSRGGGRCLHRRSSQPESRWRCALAARRQNVRPLRAKAEDDGDEAVSAPEATSTSDDSEPSHAILVRCAREAIAEGSADEDFLADFVDNAEAEMTSLSSKVDEARAALAEAQTSADSSRDQYLRLNADFDNFRKRSRTEQAASEDRVKGNTVLALVPLVDSFESARTQLKPETEGEKKIDAAYQGVYKQMVEAFRGLGVDAVAGVGSAFDPEFHDAIMREERDDLPDGTILQEFRRGFRIGAKLLRPAMVKVSYTEKAAPAQPAAETGTESGVEEEAEVAQ